MIERGFDDIEHRISNMDKEHSKYVRATVTRLNYLLSGETDTKGLVVKLLNEMAESEDQDKILKDVSQKMNLSFLEILSAKSLYKRRKSRADFISQMEMQEEIEDLDREDVLKLNRIQMRYSRAEIEDFIETHMENGMMDAEALKEMKEEDFEKLILAYDYSTRRSSKYRVLEEEPEMVVNGAVPVSEPEICAEEESMITYYEELDDEEKAMQLAGQPVSEVVYSRSDYDGYRWWTTWHDGPGKTTSPELAKEIDEFQNALFKLPAFKTLDTMRRFCRYTQATSEATEFNLYSETDHLYIWIRLITRSRDYNVYVHYYDKAAVGGK